MKVYISKYLLVLLLRQTKLMKTKAQNDLIHSFKILFDVCNFNSPVIFLSGFLPRFAYQEEETNWSLSSGLQR